MTFGERTSPRRRRPWPLVVAAALAALGSTTTRADDDTRNEFWPELDAYVRLNDRTRLFFLASVSRAREADYTEGMVGGHVDLALKPLLRHPLRETPDVLKHRYLSFRAGYRYAWDLDGGADAYREHRGIFEATVRIPLPAHVTLLDRNRFDLRNVNGETSWRYRNRVRVERDWPAWSGVVTPYAMVDLFYDSRYDAWTRQRYVAGIEWPLAKSAILDTSYTRQDDARGSPAHVNAFGLALNLFF
jgi:hypothetical protein